MADIQFEEEQYRPIQQIEPKSFFVRLVLSTGIASTDKQAEYVLLGIAVAGFIIAVFFFMRSGPPGPPPANQIIWVAGPGATPGR